MRFATLIAVAISLLWPPATTTAQEASASAVASEKIAGAHSVPLPDGQTVRLPAPLLATAQSPSARQQALEALAGRGGWERFARNSISAPTTIRLETLRDQEENRVGYQLYSAYVVYANLEQLSDQQLMESLFGDVGTQEGLVMKELSASDLPTTSVASQEEDRFDYLWMELPLLNKVLVRGIVQTQRSQDEHGVQLRWQLDPRWTQSAESAPAATAGDYQNTWSHLSLNDLGGLDEGPPRPYLGLGGQLSLMEIDPAKSQLQFESWLILYEPSNWFEAENYLRAKLPASAQESAKRFRRKLRSLSQ